MDGFRYSAAVANWDPFRGFTFGLADYGATAWECGSPEVTAQDDQCLTYTVDRDIAGTADQETGTITMTVPLDALKALAGLPAGPDEVPEEVGAARGDRIYTSAAFTLANYQAPDSQFHGFLYPLDNTAAKDFLLPEPAPAPPGGERVDGVPQPPDRGGGGPQDDQGVTPVTGGGWRRWRCSCSPGRGERGASPRGVAELRSSADSRPRFGCRQPVMAPLSGSASWSSAANSSSSIGPSTNSSTMRRATSSRY